MNPDAFRPGCLPALILFPLGLIAIAYACTVSAMRQPPPPFTPPEWAVDRYGRPYPVNYNPPAEEMTNDKMTNNKWGPPEGGTPANPPAGATFY